jgi:hypothetical protein
MRRSAGVSPPREFGSSRSSEGRGSRTFTATDYGPNVSRETSPCSEKLTSHTLSEPRAIRTAQSDESTTRKCRDASFIAALLGVERHSIVAGS